MSKGIVDTILQISKRYADQVAIIDKQRSVTYGQLEQEVHQTASYLQDRGVGTGDRVLVLVPFSIDLYRVTMAINYLGGVAVFIEDWLTLRQVGTVCQSIQPKVLVSDAKGLIFSWWHKELRKIPVRINHHKYKGATPIAQPPFREKDAVALISFTSGTSGKPKQVTRTFEFLNHQFDTLRKIKEVQPFEKELVTLPSLVFLNLLTGVTSVIPAVNSLRPERTRFARILQQMEAHSISSIATSPFLLLGLTKSISQEKALAVRGIITGGAPVFPSDARAILSVFANAELTVLYGSSEAEPISLLSGKDLIQEEQGIKNGLPVGRVHADTQLRVKVPEAKINETPIGELQVRGANVVPRRPENEGSTIWEDEVWWHQTGDSGFIRSDGMLMLTGPLKALIPYRNRLWSPFIFEQEAKEIEGVKRAALVSHRERLVAVVETESQVDQMETTLQLKNLSFPIAHVLYWKKLPVDARHGGKILFQEIETYLDRHPNL